MHASRLKLKQIQLAFILLWMMSIAACVKDKPNPPQLSYSSTQGAGIILLNEGAMGMNNASLSFLSGDTAQINNLIFEQANGFGLGDVAQGFVSVQNKYYVLINSSGFIRELDTLNFKETGRINNLFYPRQMLAVSPTKAYVTHMYKNYISVVDLQQQQVVKTISTPFANSEAMVQYHDDVYVSNWDTASNLIYKLSINGDSIAKTIPLPAKASHSMVRSGDVLWILCGNPYKGTASFLVALDLTKDSIIKSLPFPAQADPIRLSTNSKQDSLYFLMVNYNGNASLNGFYSMSVNANALPTQARIQAPVGTYFWAYGIHPTTGNIYLSDPKGFAQQGSISIYNPAGQLLRTHRGGIGTNTFYFKP